MSTFANPDQDRYEPQSLDLMANLRASIDAARANSVDVHKRDHLTDGVWHDACPHCQRRRVIGGTGVPDDR